MEPINDDGGLTMLVLVNIDVSVNWLMTLRRKVSPYKRINQGKYIGSDKTRYRDTFD